MKRTTLTASLVGSAAAGLIAAAIATPAWAQATTYPEGTDCSAIQNSASRMDCTQQLNESRQNPATGETTPDTGTVGNAPQGGAVAPNASDPGNLNNAAPNNTNNNNNNVGTGNSGTSNSGTSAPGGGTSTTQ